MKSSTKSQLIKQKRILRKRVRRIRDSSSPQQISAKSHQITDKLLSIIESNRFNTIMLYLSMESEVETFTLLHRLITLNKTVLAPIMEPASKKLYPYQIVNPETDLVKNDYGIQEPNPQRGKLLAPAEIELVTVPGIVFDARGYRIGYGGGYYDRFLKECRMALWVGLAFECQLVEDAVSDTWDLPVHKIVTEERVLDCMKWR